MNTIDKRALRTALEGLATAGETEARSILGQVFHQDAWLSICHPVEEASGLDNIFQHYFGALRQALQPLRRRDEIFMAGQSRVQENGDWIASMGHYTGQMNGSLFGIEGKGELVFLRYGEFYRIVEGRITEARLIVDLPDLLRQLGRPVFPFKLGTEMLFPGPATHDGITGALDPSAGDKSAGLVEAMLFDLRSYQSESFESSGQTGGDGYWRDDMYWYGPGGIGSNTTWQGFQRDHRIPFLTGFPDRVGGNHYARFGDGNYVASGGWPSINATHGGDYLGIPATGRRITMRVMDFWRTDGRQIAENWVFIDMPDLFAQLGRPLL